MPPPTPGHDIDMALFLSCWEDDRPPQHVPHAGSSAPPHPFDITGFDIPFVTHSTGTREYTVEERIAFDTAYAPVCGYHAPYPNKYAAELAVRRRGCIENYGGVCCVDRYIVTLANECPQLYCASCQFIFLGIPIPKHLYTYMPQLNAPPIGSIMDEPDTILWHGAPSDRFDDLIEYKRRYEALRRETDIPNSKRRRAETGCREYRFEHPDSHRIEYWSALDYEGKINK